MTENKKLAKIKSVIKRCRQSPAYFIDTFCKIKHPNAGIIPFHLFSYQRNCLDDFKANRFNIFSKTRQCFVAGTPVWTPDGPKPIEQLKIGELIYTYNTKTCGVEIVPISNVFDNNIKDTVIVRTKTGHRARVTPDHKYLTTNGWVEAQNLTQNDVVIEINDPQRYSPVDESDAIMLGYLITDGYYGNPAKSVHFTNTTWKYLLEYQKHFELKFGKRLPIKKHDWNSKTKRKNAYRIATYLKETKNWLSDLGILGQKSTTKVIPEVVFSWNNKTIAILLNRMFAGDGWYAGSGKNSANEAGLGSKSILMLFQIKQLLTRFNIDSKVYPETKSGMAKIRIIGGRSFNNFVNYIGINGKDPRRPLTQGFIKNRVKGKILSVEPSEPAEVYDLEVPPYNNFIVDGVVVHNSGVSTLCGAYALWLAMFFKTKTVLVVSKRDKDAMEFMGRNIKFVYNYLPKWMQQLWKPTVNNEHEIGFANGSKITSLPSGADTLRSNSASLNIIDEAAFCPHMHDMWAGGYPCSRGDTLIQTEDGLIKIEALANKNGEQWQDINTEVATDIGYQNCNGYYVSGKHDTTIVNTYLGFEFEGTGHHRLRIINSSGDYVWCKLENLMAGDISVNIPGQFRGKRRKLNNGIELTPQLSEIIGLYVGDGSLYKKRPKRFKICFDKKDNDTKDYAINTLNLEIKTITKSVAYEEEDKDNLWLRLNSCEFVKLMVENDLNSKTCALDAEIPEIILKSDEKVLCAFLRGLFDSDGWCYPSSTSLQLGFATASEKLSEQVQVALHSLGILSRRVKITNHSNGRFSDKPYWKLTIYDAENKQKFKKIGFISTRKQKCLDNFKSDSSHSSIYHPVLVKEFIDEVYTKMIGNGTFRSCNDNRKRNILRIRKSGKINIDLLKELSKEFNTKNRLSNYINSGYEFDTVEQIRSGYTDTYDISVPNNNTYLANGMVSHNTLQHGGSVVVVSTSNGIGDWYWKTWTDAESKQNEFNPIRIDWWEMDWAIEYKDDISGKMVRIAPADSTRRCTTKEEIEKYGEYWSPWLETQYKQLTEKGNDTKFRQEVLRDFLGSGNTVLSRDTILMMRQQAKASIQTHKTVNHVDYVQPMNGESYHMDFKDKLWIWAEPEEGHIYTMGVDIASGEASDWSAVEIFDIMIAEQVAELQIKIEPKYLSIMVDYLGRWYNNAFMVPERTGMGVTVCQELEELSYPNIFRKNMLPTASKKALINKYRGPIGYNTTGVGKPIINKAMIDNLGENGFIIHSNRLVTQAETYVHLGGNRTGAEKGTMNDDLIISAGLAFVGTNMAVSSKNNTLLPFNANVNFGMPQPGQEVIQTNDFVAICPIGSTKEPMPGQTQDEEMQRFAQTLLAPITDSQMPSVTQKKTLF